MQPTTLLALLATIAPVAVLADCCGAGFCHSSTPNCATPNACADGTKSTPCCGNGGCNIFCCNCDGGCRNRKRANNERSIPGMTAESLDDAEAFNAANADGSGNLTVVQYTQYMGAAEDDDVYLSWFKEHDKNGDGIITADEVRR